jgi:hypothetical protein
VKNAFNILSFIFLLSVTSVAGAAIEPCNPDASPEARALEKRRLILENENYQRTLEEQVASRTIQLMDALLKKGAELSEEEWQMMRKHPEIGYRILSRIKFLKEPARIVLQHHERYDGRGFPGDLKRDEIAVEASNPDI